MILTIHTNSIHNTQSTQTTDDSVALELERERSVLRPVNSEYRPRGRLEVRTSGAKVAKGNSPTKGQEKEGTGKGGKDNKDNKDNKKQGKK